MIYILHGEDIFASYNRLQQILKSYPTYQKVRLDEKADSSDNFTQILSPDLLGLQKIIICENFIHSKKIKIADLKLISAKENAIFWEKAQLTASTISKIGKNFTIELFKPKPQIYYFLDSISDSSQNTLKQLNNLKKHELVSLNWHLANRLHLLILAKLDLRKEASEKIVGKPIQDWQWQKISSQANLFNLSTLTKLFNGILKIDYLIKSGKTNLDETPLISTLLFKYLSR